MISGLLEGYSERVQAKTRGHRVCANLDLRLAERHFPGQFEDKNHRPKCTVCSILPSQCVAKGKKNCRRKQTMYFCKDCPGKPPLCVIPCFEIFHKKKKYRKTCNCSKN